MLTDTEKDMLDFERRTYLHKGAKEQAIRDLFDIPVPRYYQRLVALLSKPEAEEHDPMTVRRLRRLMRRRHGLD